MTVTATPGPPQTQPAGVRLHDITLTYPSGVTALSGLSLEIHPGEVLSVVGASGCGKSTLLELICGLQTPTEGTVVADPAVLMPQRDALLPWLSALDNAALPLRVGRHPLSKAQARAQAAMWLEKLNLSEFAETPPRELSGGMRQRISFARALLTDKPVLALDEPFAALDAITRAEVQHWLAHALGESPRTVILVTHDVEEAVLLGDRVAVMTRRPGRVAALVEIPLTRPRRRTGAELTQLREQVLEHLGAPV